MSIILKAEYNIKQQNKITNTIIKKIDEADAKFSKNINEHLNFFPLSVYMIIGAYHRLGIPNDKKCLVVSSVDIKEKYKGKGYFKKYMELLTDIAKEKQYRIVFESVLNEDLKKWILNKDYIEIPNLNNFYIDLK